MKKLPVPEIVQPTISELIASFPKTYVRKIFFSKLELQLHGDLTRAVSTEI